MLTFIVQVYLVLAVCAVVTIALVTEIQDRRESRELARANAAHAYAVRKIQIKNYMGVYDHLQNDDVIEDEFEFHRLAYLCQK